MALANAVSPLILGLTIATLALVAYDLIVIRIERFSGELDRLGAEIIDAIAMATQPVAKARVDSASSPLVRRANHAGSNSIPTRSTQHVQHQGRRVNDVVGPSVTLDHEIGF
jgi:hypothetical protein